MKRILSVAALAAGLGMVVMAGGCKSKDVVPADEAKNQPPVSVAPTPVTPLESLEGDASLQPTPKRDVIGQDEIAARWKGVEMTVAEKKEGGESFKVEIPLGGEAVVEGTPLTVKLLSFVPDFSMGAETITSKSLEDTNPAVKIEVLEEEKVLFTGWSFRDFPAMHSFEDTRYEIALTRTIPVE